MANPVGKVIVAEGDVAVAASNGETRVLQVNSPIFEGDEIITGVDSRTLIQISNGPELVVGQESNVQVDADVINSGVSEEALQDQAAEVEAIQAALEAGEELDLDQLAATAAGPAGPTAAGGSREIVQYSKDLNEQDPDGEAPTVGPALTFLAPESEFDAEEPAPPPPEVAPPPPPEAEEPGGEPPPPPPPPPPDGEPLIVGSEVIVDETFLDSGDADTETDAPEEFPLELVGFLDTLEFGLDGPGDPDVYGTDGGLDADTALESQGRPITVSVVDGNYIGTVADGDDDGDEPDVIFTLVFDDVDPTKFTYMQFDQLDHPDDTDPDDVISLKFSVTAEDGNGDTATGDVSVLVRDDGPSLLSDVESIQTAADEDGMKLATSDNSEGTGSDNSVDEDSDDSGELISSLFDLGADDYPDDEATEVIYGITQDTATLTALTGLGLTSGSDSLVYSSDGTTLTAKNSVTNVTVFTLAITNTETGSWNFDLVDQLDHVEPESGADENTDLQSTTAEGDYISGIDLSSVLTATDYDGDTVTGAAAGSFIVTVTDDIPVGGNPQNVILANEYDPAADNITGTGDLNFEVGADENIQSIVINWDGDNVDGSGYIVDNDGVRLTSDGQELVFEQVGDGIVGKVLATGEVIFTVTPDKFDGVYTGTYTVELVGELDGAATELVIQLGEKGGGNAEERLIEAGNDTDSDGDPDEILIRATALDDSSRNGAGVMSGGTTTDVNWSTAGMGVDEGDKVDPTESLILEFFDQDTDDTNPADGDDDSPTTRQSYDSLTFRLDHLNEGETAIISVYSGGTGGAYLGTFEVTGTDEGSSVASDDLVSITNTGSTSGTVISESNDPDTVENDWGIEVNGDFDTIVFESEEDPNLQGNGYRVVDVSVSTTEESQDLELTFTADATDFDGDTATSDEFIVEFEGEELDGTYDIDGTDESDVIVGSSGDDIITGGDGDDIIDGGEGVDNIDGGMGEDELFGGVDDDIDTLEGGPDDDTVFADTEAGGDEVDVVIEENPVNDDDLLVPVGDTEDPEDFG